MAKHTAAFLTTRWGRRAALPLLAASVLCSITAAPGSSAPTAGSSATTQPHASLRAPSDGFSGGKWGDALADGLAKDAYGKNSAEKDPGSLYTVEKAVGARALWSKKDRRGRPVTGTGVGVAVLDSGIARVPGLDGFGKVTYGPDLSIEGNSGLAQQDTFGHGTFMAGIIAGRGANNPPSDLATAPANIQLGVAPDAKLLAIKLATSDGSTDVSQVIAGLDWVVAHPTLPDGTPIRVINLSYGTDSAQDYRIDPLDAAVENAWRHGIVVVASVGNEGTATGRVTDPANDPFVISVAASDSGDRLDGWNRDHTRPASFSNVASGGRHADFVVPGTSVVSLRAPGSTIDIQHPEGRVSGDVSATLFRGSGTSQAAALTSGAVADLLQAYPSLSPDQVKYVLTSTAQLVTGSTPNATGAGVINLAAAYDAANRLLGTDATAATARAAAVQSFPQATGQGSLDAARGDSVLLDAAGDPIVGEVDALGNPWNATAWWRASTSGSAWSGGDWMGQTWTGGDWGSDPDGLSTARWSTARWSTARWSGLDWDTARWSTARWSTARWSTARWSTARWSGNDW